jgi:leader peptidase (prepilin peptidase)/N-methyltransferase
MSQSQLTILFVFSGLLGLVIGSFLNVCIFRLPRNCMSIVKPRSRCPRCLNWIAWYDNLPVISWAALGGKCRHCRNPISIRYTLVELLTGALFLYAGWRAIYGLAGPVSMRAERFAVDAWFVSVLIICTFVDLEFRIIPDEVSLSGIVIGLAAGAAFPLLCGQEVLVQERPWSPPKPAYRLNPNFALPWTPGEPHLAALAGALVGMLLGAGSVYAVGVFGKIIFRKRIRAAGEEVAMGFGDVKFMAMVGAVLGWRGVLLTFLIACLCGSIFGIGKLIVKRQMGYVPFGPFLALGALTLLFFPGQVDAALKAYLNFNQEILEHFFPRPA